MATQVKTPIEIHPAARLDGEQADDIITLNIELVFIGNELPIATVVHRLRAVADSLIRDYIQDQPLPPKVLELGSEVKRDR